MVAMFAVVVIVVIGLDVIIKALCLVGAPFRYLVLLRLVHPLVCAFVLSAEYELLHAKHADNERADNERAETERLLAERERQYRLSRENIETVRDVTDAERRAIAVSVQRRGRMVAVSVENCCAHVPRIPEGGLPETTKNDRENHGFGMRSMRQIAERYGGSLHAGVESDVFYLNVLLAMPT